MINLKKILCYSMKNTLIPLSFILYYYNKTPENFKYIGLIFSIFPNAKIIHLKRDPRAICWSIYQSNWYGNGYGFSYNMDDLVKYYSLYSKLMDFWHKKFPGKIYDICYEDLTTNQEEGDQKIIGVL